MLIHPKACPGKENLATGVELYKGCFKVEKLKPLPGTKLEEGEISVIFKLMDLPQIAQSGIPAKEGYSFGLGKSVIFPAVPGCKAPLEMSLKKRQKVIGSMVAFLDEVLKCLAVGTSETINCSVVLANNERKRVAMADLKLIITRVGPCKTEDCKINKEVKNEPQNDRHKFVFKTKEVNPKFQVELSAPRGKPRPVIPPYHEDVAVQTVVKERKKKKGKKAPNL